MEVISQKGSTMGYKIAYLAKPITASSETDQNAKNNASSFVGNSRDEKSFNETFEKEWKPKGYTKGLAYDIKPVGAEISGLGHSRELVRKIYDADKGTVLQPERVGDNYIVAVVTEVLEEGTQPIARARGMVEPLLRNKKKAEIIKKEIGPITTLEAVATKLGRSVEPIDSIRMTGSQPPALGGSEPKVIGAAFNPANRGKVVTEALEGVSAVFVVRVNNVSAVAVALGSVDEQRKMMYEQAKQRAMYSQPVQALRESANIKDNRSKHF
jgi:peptidyl-prolyl cis-trans isomerase D